MHVTVFDLYYELFISLVRDNLKLWVDALMIRRKSTNTYRGSVSV